MNVWIMIAGGLGVLLVVVWVCIWYLRRPAQDEWSKYTVQFRDYVERRKRLLRLAGASDDVDIDQFLREFTIQNPGSSPFAGDVARKLLREFRLRHRLTDYS